MRRWQRISREPAVVGRLYEGRFGDALGTWEDEGPFFLDEDGFWYRVDDRRPLPAFPIWVREPK